jgi:hypothetical protein
VLEIILNSRVLATLIWAALILIALYKFENPICALIGRIKAAKGPGGTAIEFEPPGISLLKEVDKAPKEYYTFNLGLHLVGTLHILENPGFQASAISDYLEKATKMAEKSGLDKTAESIRQMRKNLLTQTRELSQEDRKVISGNLVEIGKEAREILMGKEKSIEK